MSVKRKGREGSHSPVSQGPRVTAKATLLEIQSRSEYDKVPSARCLTPMSPLARRFDHTPRPLSQGIRKSGGRDTGHKPRRRDEWMAYHTLERASEVKLRIA